MKTLRRISLILLLFVLLAKTSAFAQTLSTARKASELPVKDAAHFNLRKILETTEGDEQPGASNFERGRKCFLGTTSGPKSAIAFKDFRLAARYFGLAATEGNSAAQLCLALMLYRGEGVGQDESQAHTMLERAKRGPRNNNFVRLAWYLDDLLTAR
ncbi:MAG: sel1 repeat family protein [Cyanobacteria bacterium SZAS LIN-3]|nr:sel1 repeat family protein [Cyanobacteria bacterium SZAS LIN-3]